MTQLGVSIGANVDTPLGGVSIAFDPVDGSGSLQGEWGIWTGGISVGQDGSVEGNFGVGRTYDLPGGQSAGVFGGFIIDEDGVGIKISGSYTFDPINGYSAEIEASTRLFDWDDFKDALDKLDDLIPDTRPDGGGGLVDGPAQQYENGREQQNRQLLDPIVIDLDGDGIELLPQSNVRFDMDGDGLKELTGWVAADDGLLAIDDNKNGRIDSISELIGDLSQSGFAELAKLDSNKDQIINSSDLSYASLKVWKDANSNGITDAGELKSLAATGVRAIDLRYTTVNFTAEGNRIHESSTFEWSDGRTGTIVDAWLDVSNVSNNSIVDLAPDATIDKLPNLPGYGDVRSLHEAMHRDGALTSLVVNLVGRPATKLGDVRGLVEQILYRWTGANDVSPSARGPNFDARKLSALEEILGTPFEVNGTTDPLPRAVPSLQAAWDSLVDGVLSRLLIESSFSKIVASEAVYSTSVDRIIIRSTPENLFSALKAGQQNLSGADAANYWIAASAVVREAISDADLYISPEAYNNMLSEATVEVGLSPFSEMLGTELKALPSNGVISGDGLYLGTGKADSVILTGGKQAVYGQDGDDRLVAADRSWGGTVLLDGGVGADVLCAGSGADWLDGGSGADTLYGGTGDDTYVVDLSTDRIVEASSGGRDHVRSSLGYALGAHLEDLTLLGTAALSGTGNAGANVLTGNGGANILRGLDGDDTLDGGAGADTLQGGRGRDSYVVDHAGDRIVEEGTGGSDIDEVFSTISYTAPALVENVTLLGTANLSVTGNSLNNRLTGNAGHNVLNGGIGADAMFGGRGNDTYYVDTGGDQVGEETGEGNDLVMASVSHTLDANVERLSLTGTDAIDGIGNELANTLKGNAGANLLDGREGADAMSGGAGDDVYIVDHARDRVTEAVRGGLDAVRTSLAGYTLGAELENLHLYVDGVDGGNRNGTGNGLGNLIEGSDGINVLKGLDGDDTLVGLGGNDTLEGGAGRDWLDGGEGADAMLGGAGDDTYVVDAAGDRITEAANAGIDTVRSSISHILGANVEHLVLEGFGDMDGQGNNLANRLTGNDAANKLDGGAGADVMAGNDGDDTYTVDHAGDRVVEAPGAGHDTVRSTLTYRLDIGVEDLVLLGTANLVGSGNELNNAIFGNAGNNRIDGGFGSDTLHGFAGKDTFVFSAGIDLRDSDEIMDFAAVDDTIELSKAVFGTLTVGTLKAASFKDLSKGEVDSNDRIIYDRSSGELFYDADGSGANSEAIRFAILSNTAAISGADFLVV